MLSTDQSGRAFGIQIDNNARYMPHLVVDDRANRSAKRDENGISTEHYMGVVFGPAEVLTDSTTGSGRYPLRLMYYPRVDYKSLAVGTTFTVREGGTIVGHGVVIQRSSMIDSDQKT